MIASHLPTTASKPALRFSIGSILWTTGTVAVLLTYLKLFEPHELVAGTIVIGMLTLVGAIGGSLSNRFSEVAYCSMLGAMTAFVCAVGEPLAHDSFQYAWPMVGAFTAASAILLDRYPLGARMAWGAAIGFAVLTLWSLVSIRLGATNAWTEVVCGPIAGAIMVGVVWVLETLRSWRSYSRSKLVFVLTIGVVGGNVFGRWAGWL